MNSIATVPGVSPPDLTTCDREPIHLPGSVQPHGLLACLSEPELRVEQISANSDAWLGPDPRELLGHPLDRLVDASLARELRSLIDRGQLDDGAPAYVGTFAAANGRAFDAVAHRHDGVLILELQAAGADRMITFAAIHPLVRTFVASLQRAADITAISDLAAREIRRVSGFDRVLVYRFDPDWNGEVIGESRAEGVPSYMHLRFPASDIPRQAREMYRLNPLRLIADASYRPVPLVPPLHPRTGRPLDLTFAALRSVSPIHLEYLRNMGVSASMSVSILVNGKLWGLVACHHRSPRVLGFDARIACEHLGQVLSLQIESKEETLAAAQRLRLRSELVRLLADTADQDDFVRALAHNGDRLMRWLDADGVAIVFEGRCTLIGRTPSGEQVLELADWLGAAAVGEVFSTDCLSARYPGAAAMTDTASGVLAASISQLYRSYVIWFRPEVIQTVRWGGDPRKPVERDPTSSIPDAPGAVRLSPRKSFEQWKEVVRSHSVPWLASETEAAAEFRNAIVGIVLRRAEEMAQLADELRRANQELEAFSYSVSHDLRAPLRHIVGYAELLNDFEGKALSDRGRRFLETIAGSARFAGTLVDNLLAFSQMGRAALRPAPVDLKDLVGDVINDLRNEAQGREIEWRVHDLPVVLADAMFLKLAVNNLLANAVKYTRGRPKAVIEVFGERSDRECVVHVRDNGVGFDMRYVGKLFGVFQRLHRMEEFEGTGIGLANVRRIVTRHGGRTWAEGKLGEGATFSFSLPLPRPDLVSDPAPTTRSS
jgi:light-regulated signal transduction histidine kinase (bacteriophytochrome)